MSGRDAGFADFFDLRGPLVFDFVEVDGISGQLQEECFGAAEEFAVVVEDGSDELARGGGRAVTEVEVNADSEIGGGFGGGEGGVECGAVGEEGRAGDDAVEVGVEDAAVDAFAPGQVVGVDDEVFHGRWCTLRESWSGIKKQIPRFARNDSAFSTVIRGS